MNARKSRLYAPDYARPLLELAIRSIGPVPVDNPQSLPEARRLRSRLQKAWNEGVLLERPDWERLLKIHVRVSRLDELIEQLWPEGA